ncbi:MAG: rhomboid family intramembrane serine protease [Planctomycetota bacterium]
MGIHDRDYIKSRSSSPGGLGGGVLGRPGKWSVVTWLMIINAAVFMIDAGFSSNGVFFNVSLGRSYDAGVDRRSVSPEVNRQDSDRIPVGATGTVFMPAHPIIDRNTGVRIGYEPFIQMPPATAIGHFSTTKAFVHLEIWRFLSFQFLHANFTHLLLNMIGLYFFGPIVERALHSRRLFLAFYLTCGIFGAFIYLLLNVIGFLDLYPWTPLVGASAGVFGILMAAAFLVPKDAMMLVFFVLPMRVRTGVYLFVALAAANLIMGGSNAGGDAAHLGGAAAGAFFIRKPQLLLDFFDDFLFFGGDGKRKHKGASGKTRRTGREAKVDAILAKVRDQGMHSLTKRERKTLDEATNEKRSA